MLRSHDRDRHCLEHNLTHPALAGFHVLAAIRRQLRCPLVPLMSLALLQRLLAQAALVFRSVTQLLRGRLQRESALWHQFRQTTTNKDRAPIHQLEVCHVRVPGIIKLRTEHRNMETARLFQPRCHFRS